MKEINALKVLECKRIKDYYSLKYLSTNTLGYKNYDDIRIRDTENNIFIATIKTITNAILEIYMSVQYEKSIVGDIHTELIFSPLTSIEGAIEIIKVTKTFPACHYDKLISFKEEDSNLIFLISLESYNQIMKLFFFDIKEILLSNYQETNILLQLDFRNCKENIEVIIDSLDGLNGTFICKRIKAELLPLF